MNKLDAMVAAFEAWAESRGYSIMDRRPHGSPHPRYPAIQTESAWQAWQAAGQSERNRALEDAAKACEETVRRIVHVRADDAMAAVGVICATCAKNVRALKE